MAINAALKAFADGSAEILGLSEDIGQTVSALALEDVDPLVYGKGDFMFGGTDYDYLRKISLTLNNQSMPDGYGISSLYRQYQQKGVFGGEGDFSIRLDASTYAERAKTFAGTVVSLSFFFKGKDIATDLPEMMLTEIPYSVLSVFEYETNGPVIDAHMGYKATYPKGIKYNDPVRVIIVSTDGQAY